MALLFDQWCTCYRWMTQFPGTDQRTFWSSIHLNTLLYNVWHCVNPTLGPDHDDHCFGHRRMIAMAVVRAIKGFVHALPVSLQSSNFKILSTSICCWAARKSAAPAKSEAACCCYRLLYIPFQRLSLDKHGSSSSRKSQIKAHISTTAGHFGADCSLSLDNQGHPQLLQVNVCF
jgi:hypothetical protein